MHLNFGILRYLDLLPFGNSSGDTTLRIIDDGASNALTKTVSCPFFGTNEDTIYVSKYFL